MEDEESRGRGRGITYHQSFKSSSDSESTLNETDESLYVTRPENSKKTGSSGTVIKLCANYFKLKKPDDFKFTQYHVKIEPECDFRNTRLFILGQQREQLGGYIFDGGNDLFATKDIGDQVEFSTTTNKGETYKTVIRKTKRIIEVNTKTGMRLLNIILRGALNGLKLQPIRRNLFDPVNKIELHDHRIELWPGYVTSIRQHENDILLCAEISHKVLRKDTLYDVFRKCQNESDMKERYMREVVGSIIMTDYNNKTYRIDDVDWSMTPSNFTFEWKDKTITLIEYYRTRYGKEIKDPRQPLLITNPKPREIRGKRELNTAIYLIPEFCIQTGLNESMRNNFQLMKAMSEYTRMDPIKRVNRLLDFNNRLIGTQQGIEKFQKYDTFLEKNLVSLEGRLLKQEEIIFGNDRKAISQDQNVDWTNPMKMNPMFANVDLSRWGIIYPKRAATDTQLFVTLLTEVANGMRYKMSAPKMIEIPDDKNASYARELENFLSKDPKFIMLVVPNQSADRYSAIKKITCVKNSVPTQVVVQKTMQPKKGNIGSVKSIATKVLIQINCKMGGAAWTVNIPIKGLMCVGFDVNHDSTDKRKSYGAFIASMNLKEKVSFFSAVSAHHKDEECSGNIAMNFRKALYEYFQCHGTYPEKVLMYRDGVGEGDLERVHQNEVKELNNCIREAYMNGNVKEEPKFAFIIVSKRINTRFFNSGSRPQNPFSGTVVDNTVTLPERYDFYLISQSVRQGTVSPTSYNVIYDTIGLPADRLQMLTYKMCHLYWNWSGTTRVPAVLQYAQKLAVLVGQHLHQEAHVNLRNQLYFL